MREGDSLTVYSPESAMGAAINGRKKGETVAYNAPNGKELKVEIIDAEPYRSCLFGSSGPPDTTSACRASSGERGTWHFHATETSRLDVARLPAGASSADIR